MASVYGASVLPRVEHQGQSIVPPLVLHALKLLEPVVLARRRINDGNYNADDADGIYELFMLAHDNQELAEEMRLRAHQRIIDKTCRRGTR